MKSLPISLAAVLVLSGIAMAHTGPLVGGEPAVTELTFSTMDAIASTHDETQNNPSNAYKGWWWVTLTNNTTTPWTGMQITPGTNDLVAIVEGTGLQDEWGFTGNSVAVNRPLTSMLYSAPRGDGSRLYENGVTGNLWGQALATFATSVAPGGKVSFKIYTDNSWYEGPYASSFTMVLTPVPEPATFGFLGTLSVLALAWRRRR